MKEAILYIIILGMFIMYISSLQKIGQLKNELKDTRLKYYMKYEFKQHKSLGGAHDK